MANLTAQEQDRVLLQAILVAIEAPEKQPKWAVKCSIHWETIHELRRVLKEIGAPIDEAIARVKRDKINARAVRKLAREDAA